MPINIGDIGHVIEHNTIANTLLGKANSADLDTTTAGFISAAGTTAMKTALDSRYPQKGALVANVKDFGAVGNGVTDDTTAIQAAINAASTAGGGTVYLPQGKYPVTLLTLGSGITLEGSGMGATEIIKLGTTGETITAIGTLSNVATSTATADIAVGATSVTVGSTVGLAVDAWVVIGDSTVPDSAYADRRGGELAQIASVVSATVATLRWPVRGTYGTVGYTSYTVARGAALYVMGPLRNIAVQNMTIRFASPGTSTTMGVKMHRVINFLMENVEVYGFDNPALELSNVYSANVRGCYMHDITDDLPNFRFGYGVNVGAASELITVNNCRFDRVRHAFTTNGTSHFGVPRNLLVSNSIAVHTTEASWDSHGAGSQIVFDNLVSIDSSTYGISVRGRDVTVRNCSVVSPALEGYLIASTSAQRVQFVSCSVKDAGRDGLRILFPVIDVLIESLTIDGAQESGIAFIYGTTDLKIVGPKIFNVGQSATQGNGISSYGVTLTSTPGLFISGGTFVKNKTYATGAYRQAIALQNAVVTGAVLVNNTGYGLRTDLAFVLDSGAGTVKFNNRPVDLPSGIDSVIVTTTDLTTATSAINLRGKFNGCMVWNTTTKKAVWANGSTSTSPWVDATGVTAHTPV